jgi:hypothetical protein
LHQLLKYTQEVGMKRIFLTVALSSAFFPLCFAGPVDGVVKDKKTGETLIGSLVQVKGSWDNATTTGLDGTFSLKGQPDQGNASSSSSAIVWQHDTTLVTSFKVPKGASLYIMPGVTVTIAAELQEEDLHPIEIVALGNIYALGTAEKPVIIKSDKGNAEDWGGIICGYECQEAFFSNTEIRDAGATPTESSMSYMNQLFKTTIDGGVPAFHFCNTYGKFRRNS